MNDKYVFIYRTHDVCAEVMSDKLIKLKESKCTSRK